MRVPSAGRRSAVLAAALACVVAVSVIPRPQAQAGPTRHAPGLDDAGYLALADRLQRRLDPLWNAAMGRYEPGPGAADAQVNADLLLVHAVAARHGHRGPARQDARARSVARFLVSPALFSARPPLGADPQVKGAGWVAAPGRPQRHPVFDIEVIEALTQAYLARDALRLDAETVAADPRRDPRRWRRARTTATRPCGSIRSTGTPRSWPPTRRSTARTRRSSPVCTATWSTSSPAWRRSREQPETSAPGCASTTCRGARRAGGSNVDSAEYANIVLSFSRYYGAARSAGMRPPSELPLLRDWVRRVVSGYWTHGGYLNWDTGLSFSRWHQRKKVGLAQQALIGIAAERELQPGAAWGAWAKWMLDRGLLAYDAQAAHGIPSSAAYDVDQLPSSRALAYLAAARAESNAMRALLAGLGRRASSRPPALYAYDPDTGRLAVTTPAYNTAIVAVNQRTIPYGGLDLARLFDGDQEVAANLGGSGRAAFGLHVRGGVSTQYGDRRYEPGVTPLRLTRAPLGVHADASERRAYAGPFEDLRAAGEIERDGVRASTRYRFTPQLHRGPLGAPRVTARRRDGHVPELGSRRAGRRAPARRSRGPPRPRRRSPSPRWRGCTSSAPGRATGSCREVRVTCGSSACVRSPRTRTRAGRSRFGCRAGGAGVRRAPDHRRTVTARHAAGTCTAVMRQQHDQRPRPPAGPVAHGAHDRRAGRGDQVADAHRHRGHPRHLAGVASAQDGEDQPEPERAALADAEDDHPQRSPRPGATSTPSRPMNAVPAITASRCVWVGRRAASTGIANAGAIWMSWVTPLRNPA